MTSQSNESRGANDADADLVAVADGAVSSTPDGSGHTHDTAQRSSHLRTLATKPIAVLLVLMMAVGSVVLWIGIPVGWVWVASRTVKTSQPSLGPYLLVLCATPLTMWLWGKVLFRLNDLYSRLTGQSHEVRAQLPWLRSTRGERTVSRPTTVLDMVMIVSVSIALAAFGIWFFFFAGSSIPNL